VTTTDKTLLDIVIGFMVLAGASILASRGFDAPLLRAVFAFVCVAWFFTARWLIRRLKPKPRTEEQKIVDVLIGFYFMAFGPLLIPWYGEFLDRVAFSLCCMIWFFFSRWVLQWSLRLWSLKQCRKA